MHAGKLFLSRVAEYVLSLAFGYSRQVLNFGVITSAMRLQRLDSCGQTKKVFRAGLVQTLAM